MGLGPYSKTGKPYISGLFRHEENAEPVATANGPAEPWLISNVRQNSLLMSRYEATLTATKEFYPFEAWSSFEDDMEQYSEANCGEAAAIFDRLISKLISLGERASEEQKLAAFKEAVEALNALDEECSHMLIETSEAEQLCELCSRIASAAGLDPKKYAGGEGPASLWRDW